MNQLLEPPAACYYRGGSAKTTFEEILLEDLAVPTDQGELESANCDARIKEPRADGGRDAWFFLAACFVFEALIWGKFCLDPIRSYLTRGQASRSPLVSFKHTIPLRLLSSATIPMASLQLALAPPESCT